MCPAFSRRHAMWTRHQLQCVHLAWSPCPWDAAQLPPYPRSTCPAHPTSLHPSLVLGPRDKAYLAPAGPITEEPCLLGHGVCMGRPSQGRLLSGACALGRVCPAGSGGLSGHLCLHCPLFNLRDSVRPCSGWAKTRGFSIARSLYIKAGPCSGSAEHWAWCKGCWMGSAAGVCRSSDWMVTRVPSGFLAACNGALPVWVPQPWETSS